MKRVTPTEARRHWFRLLDEVAEGEVLVIEREGARLVLRRQDSDPEGLTLQAPDYDGLIWAENPDEADRWNWDWDGENLALRDQER